MKARIENNTIKIYRRLPRFFHGVTGTYPGGFYKLNSEILEQEGFYDIIEPEYDPYTQKLGAIYFDKKNEVFTYSVLQRTDLPTLEEAKIQKIKELKELAKDLYQTIQWYVEMFRMEDRVVPIVVRDKIRLIKTKYDQVKAQINALTDVVSVLKYELPYSQVDSMKDDLENIN